jgi:ketosteroid isomerase-like protein
MKRSSLILPLVILLCFMLGCQQPAEETITEGLTEEEVNAIATEVVKVYNDADMEAFDKVYAADYVEHDPLQGEIIGIDAFKQRIQALHEEYSSINLSIDETFIKGDRAAVFWTVEEVHKSGAVIKNPGVSLVRIVDGKIAEANFFYDTKNVLEQMGFKIVPPEEPEKK